MKKRFCLIMSVLLLVLVISGCSNAGGTTTGNTTGSSNSGGSSQGNITGSANAGGSASGSTTGSANAGETTSGKIGIIGAMEEEVTLLKEALTDPKITTIADMEFCEGILDDEDVVVVQCGMGKVNAGICANTLINQFHCSRIINTGVAGSLDNRINIGDIVVSVDACQHDYDVEAIGFKKGEIPYTGLSEFPADETLRKEAVEAVQTVAPDVRVFEGRVCTGDQFISSKEQKESIKSNFGGLCCEMEGGAIAQACYLNHTPFVIIRAISDKADESEEISYEVFKKAAAEHCASIVRHMIIHLNE